MIPMWLLTLPWALIQKLATEFEIPATLIAAIVSVESSGKACATRYEPHYRWTTNIDVFAARNRITPETELVHQKTSWGLMQVMGAVAREQGFKGHLTELCKPSKGLRVGCSKLKALLNKYESIEDAVSAYNQGSPRKDSNGEYFNKSYVEKVMVKHLLIQDANIH